MSALDEAMVNDSLREALGAVLRNAIGVAGGLVSYRAMEENVRTVFARFHAEHGTPDVPSVYLLVGARNPGQICIFDEAGAQGAVDSGEWVDPQARIHPAPKMYRACGGIRRGAAVVMCECGGVREARAGCTTH